MKTIKVVLNERYGGFSVSDRFLEHYNIPSNNNYKIGRYDERLIEFIETYGSEAASGKYANLIVREIPVGTHYNIAEHNGYERIEYININIKR